MELRDAPAGPLTPELGPPNRPIPGGRPRVEVVCTAVAAMVSVVSVSMLALQPHLVIDLAGAEGTMVAGPIRIVTDLYRQGPLTWLVRASTYVILGVAVLGAAFLGLVSAIRAPGRPGVGSLASFLGGSSLGLCLLYIVVLLLPDRGPDMPSAWLLPVEVFGTAAMGFAAGALLNFAARFPVPLPVEQVASRYAESRKRAALIRSEWPFVRMLSSPTDGVARHQRVVRRALRTVQAGWLPIALGLLLGGGRIIGPLIAAALLWYMLLVIPVGTHILLSAQHRFGDACTRERLTWILGGFSSALWALILLGSLPFGLVPLLGGVGYGLYLAALFALSPPVIYAILVAGLAMAVFYQGAIDPELAIRRSTLFGVTAVLFVGAYGGLENLVSGWLEGRMGMPGSMGSALTGAFLAIGLLPLQGPLRRVARRLEPSFLQRRDGGA